MKINGYNLRHWSSVAVVALFLSLFLLLAKAQSIPKDAITHPNEAKSLLDVKASLVDVNDNLSNWKKGDPCTANWTGVLCFNSRQNDGYLHVRELQLFGLNLSGTLSPSLGNFSRLKILDFMWNNISGSIPKEIGIIKSLVLLLVNGNQLVGSLPDELGYLPNLDRIQIDQNKISGPLPASFANLNKTKHFHMNNNSISGQIPPELSRLPNLVHFLLDNNNLTGFIPPQFSQLPKILIIQLDNNNFQGTIIPESFGNISTLLKLSLRNCRLDGPMPDLSRSPNLGYLDLSRNNLNGPIPKNQLSSNITTIDLSYNNLNGTIPAFFSRLPRIQKLSLENNSLSGSISSSIWKTRPLNSSEKLKLNLKNNQFSSISGTTSIPENVTVSLKGNPACANSTFAQLCGVSDVNNFDQNFTNSVSFSCKAKCPQSFEYSPYSPIPCFCAAPLIITYRLKSPGFYDFIPYKTMFEDYLTSGLVLNLYQLDLYSFMWEEGPRLKMDLKLFPSYNGTGENPNLFNETEALRILGMFTGWNIPDSDIFGPYELLDIFLLPPYRNLSGLVHTSSGLSTGQIIGIVLGGVAAAVLISSIVSVFIIKTQGRKLTRISKPRPESKVLVKIDGVRAFDYNEMAEATNNFDRRVMVGQGGYGKVYRGVLLDGTVVAIKRAQKESLQGEKEFLTEIELLSRLHHRNLLSLIGYCDEEGEEMLVYEFMEKGTLRDHISVRSKQPLGFTRRFEIALASARGVLYLHTEANPPVIHRDIKATNILLDSNFNAKVADFGLSRLAPMPDSTNPAHISTAVKGTPGYLDPEYFLTHKLTDKSDVYSMGVVFLELLTGLQPISQGKNIVREVGAAYESGKVFAIVDARMEACPMECAERLLRLALRCCKENTDERPSMSHVVRELENIKDLMTENYSKIREGVSVASEKDLYSMASSSVISGSNLVSGSIPRIDPR